MTDDKVQVLASAPGKVVLSGEYAVLDGAPAVCMALDRRARVTIATSGDDHHRVSAPGLCDQERRFRCQDGVFEWLDAGFDFGLLEAAWLATNMRSDAGLSLILDTRDFVDPDSGQKSGIGSSAALTVALTAALNELSHSTIDAVDAAFAAHQELQQGHGSGVDIACSLAGGLIEYRASAKQSQSLAWPDGLAYALVWSGAAASTTQKLEQLARSEARPSRMALVCAAKRLANAWRQQAAAEILEEYRDYTTVLREFSLDHELGIFDAGHAELVEAAQAAGINYKPCGAGGGDIGIVLAQDAAAIQAFVDNALTAEYRVLDVSIDLQGVTTERTQH